MTWNPNQTIRSGIGQSVVSVTPIAVARYIAALVNGGQVFGRACCESIVDGDGNVVESVERLL